MRRLQQLHDCKQRALKLQPGGTYAHMLHPSHTVMCSRKKAVLFPTLKSDVHRTLTLKLMLAQNMEVIQEELMTTPQKKPLQRRVTPSGLILIDLHVFSIF